jgi:hypothetical protein
MNYTEIKNKALLFKKSPRSNVWEDLEIKLDQHIIKPEKKPLFTLVAYAAGFSGFMIICYFLLSSVLNGQKNNHPQFEIVKNNAATGHIYSVEKITSLKYAYAKLHYPDVSQKNKSPQ